MRISEKFCCDKCRALKKVEIGRAHSGALLYEHDCILGYNIKDTGCCAFPDEPCPKPLDLTELHVAKITMRKDK